MKYPVFSRFFGISLLQPFCGIFTRLDLRSFEHLAHVVSVKGCCASKTIYISESLATPVCIMSPTVLLRSEIPRNNARHACKYGRAPQMGHSDVSRYCFHQRWSAWVPTNDHAVTNDGVCHIMFVDPSITFGRLKCARSRIKKFGKVWKNPPWINHYVEII